MILISSDFTAQSASSDSVLGVVANIGGGNINSDLMGYVSADGGTSWDTATLVDRGEFESDKNMYGCNVDLTNFSDTTMAYKLTTSSDSTVKIYGTGFNWRS